MIAWFDFDTRAPFDEEQAAAREIFSEATHAQDCDVSDVSKKFWRAASLIWKEEFEAILGARIASLRVGAITFKTASDVGNFEITFRVDGGGIREMIALGRESDSANVAMIRTLMQTPDAETTCVVRKMGVDVQCVFACHVTATLPLALVARAKSLESLLAG